MAQQNVKHAQIDLNNHFMLQQSIAMTILN